MALSVGDIIQIIDVQTVTGQQVLNVYHYRMDEVGADVDLADVVNVFQGQVIPAVAVIQHSNLVHTSMIAQNLTNGIDIYEEPISVAGTKSGEMHPSFVAYAFRYVRATGLTRHGYKRFGGVPEDATTSNNLVASYVTMAATLAGVLDNPLTVDSGSGEDFIATPVIVGRIPQGEPDAGRFDLSRINDISGVQFVRITSQTTRRVGRGA